LDLHIIIDRALFFNLAFFGVMATTRVNGKPGDKPFWAAKEPESVKQTAGDGQVWPNSMVDRPVVLRRAGTPEEKRGPSQKRSKEVKTADEILEIYNQQIKAETRKTIDAKAKECSLEGINRATPRGKKAPSRKPCF
jgi:hypothetical protein